jgi:hypothetical protein
VTDKKLEVVFAPGCFDDFEGTQEELDEFVADIHRMVESGEFFTQATPITEEMLDDMPGEVLDQLANALGMDLTDESFVVDVPSKKNLH